MYGPAARCKRDDGSAGGAAVLHQCIRPRTWSVFHRLRATMDMRAYSSSLAVMSASTIRVTRFRMRREDRSSMPCFFPLADLGGKTLATDHTRICLPSSSFVRSGRPFLRPGRHVARGAARRARSRLAARQPMPVAPPRPGHVSTAPSTVASVMRAGAHDRSPCASRTGGQSAARPRRCGRACWRARWRACCNVAAAPPLGSSA
jgi:hypothetical protein